MRLFLPVGLAMVLVSAPLSAQTNSAQGMLNFFTDMLLYGTSRGSGLLRFCQMENAKLQNAECDGYISGVVDTGKSSGWVCLPGDLTKVQVKDGIIGALREKPADLHKPSAELVIKYLKAAYPCR